MGHIVVHMSDIQTCTHDNLEKYMLEAIEDVKSNGDEIACWVFHGDTNAFKPNKHLTEKAAKQATIPRPELRWIAALIAGDGEALPYPERKPIDTHSQKYKELAEILREGSLMTRNRLRLISRITQTHNKEFGQGTVYLLRGNSEPVYSWWTLFGHTSSIESHTTKSFPIDIDTTCNNLIAVEDICNWEGIQMNLMYLNHPLYGWPLNYAVSFKPYGYESSALFIPWADSQLLEMIAQYAGHDLESVTFADYLGRTSAKGIDLAHERKIEESILTYLQDPKLAEKLKRNRLKRLTINMHSAPTVELSSEALKYEGKHGKRIEQPAVIESLFRLLGSLERDGLDIRVLYGHDGVEVFVDQMAELHGVEFRGIHLVEEGPAHYEDLMSGEITLSSSAQAKHNETVRKYKEMQVQNGAAK